MGLEGPAVQGQEAWDSSQGNGEPPRKSEGPVWEIGRCQV